ncbi:hypothetical protein TSUD_320700 [Trifolium subterraneum]|uniref:peroxidase n=1 Tax=Trifolium subterraneum TaxID=3900 RepID=A0A2Z6MZA5_TRISU|nr:hypothetical protein TSUD_320700 [Trifolium subterraneum]
MSNSYLQLLLLLVLYIISANSAQPYEGNYGEAVFTLQVPTLEETNLDNLLSFGYYHKSCPQFESTLHNKVKEWIKKDETLAASLLRLHFHDCSVRGHENITSLIEYFQSKGLTVLDLVVLSGAHTIGRTTCGSIQNRLYNYQGTGKPDPSIDAKYLNFLKRKCRWASEYVDLDATTPKTFDRMYYINLKKNMGLLSTDQWLQSDPRTSPLVSALSASPSVFEHQFAVSMSKFGVIDVLTEEDEGEIRTNCNYVNAY